jgi:hypothetical protein
MSFKDFLNTFIEEAVLEGYPTEMSVGLLLSEDTHSLEEGLTVLEMVREEYEEDELLEVARRRGPRRARVVAKRPKFRTPSKPKRRAGGGMRGQKRIFRKVAGGGRLLIKKVGRVNVTRSLRMRRSKAKRSMAAKRAARNPQTKMRRKRTMAVRSRMMPRKRKMGSSRPKAKSSYRGFHKTKRHAAPRRSTRPGFRPRRR